MSETCLGANFEKKIIKIKGTPKCPIDNSHPAYFISKVAKSKKFIIWLGDSELCSDFDACKKICEEVKNCNNDPAVSSLSQLKYCFYRELNCFPGKWPEEKLCGSSIFKELKDYNKVFLPQCTFDMFLGKAKSPPFQGNLIFANLLKELQELNLGEQEVILGGSGRAGIGVLNLLNQVSVLLKLPTLLKAIVDSSWVLKSFNFRPEKEGANSFQLINNLYNLSFNYIKQAQLDPNCQEKIPNEKQLTNCLIPSELIQSSKFIRETRIFFVQNQYDIDTLFELGVFSSTSSNEDISKLRDSSVNNVIDFIEKVGSESRGSVTDAFVRAGEKGNHSFFWSSCAGHATVTPLEIFEFDSKAISMNFFGQALVTRSSDSWEKTFIKSNSLSNALLNFLEVGSQDSNAYIDTCASFLCDPSCKIDFQIQPIVIETSMTDLSKAIIISLSFSFIFLAWGIFCITYFRIWSFQRETSREWKRLNHSAVTTIDPGATSIQATELLDESSNSSIIEEFRNRKSFLSLMVTNLSYYPNRGRMSKPILDNINL